MDEDEDPFADLEEILATDSRLATSSRLANNRREFQDQQQRAQLDTLSEVSEELSLSWRDASLEEKEARIIEPQNDRDQEDQLATEELSTPVPNLLNLASELRSPSVISSSSEEPSVSQKRVESEAESISPVEVINNSIPDVEPNVEQEEETEHESVRQDEIEVEPTRNVRLTDEPLPEPDVDTSRDDHDAQLLELIDDKLSLWAASVVDEVRAIEKRWPHPSAVDTKVSPPEQENQPIAGSGENESQKPGVEHKDTPSDVVSRASCQCKCQATSNTKDHESKSDSSCKQDAENDEYEQLLDYYNSRLRHYNDSILIGSMGLSLNGDDEREDGGENPLERMQGRVLMKKTVPLATRALTRQLLAQGGETQMEDVIVRDKTGWDDRESHDGHQHPERVMSFCHLRRKSIDLLGAIQRAASQLEISRRKFELADRLPSGVGMVRVTRDNSGN